MEGNLHRLETLAQTENLIYSGSTIIDKVIIELTLRETNLGTYLETVDTGEQAMACLRKQGKFETSPRPDLIILDVYLNGQSGLELLSKIRAEKEFLTIPVVMFTACDSEAKKNAASSLNVSAFLSKPWDVDRYMSILKATESYWSILKNSTDQEPLRRAS
jgi:chemotaxis family two-component system response regulator Rcp1